MWQKMLALESNVEPVVLRLLC